MENKEIQNQEPRPVPFEGLRGVVPDAKIEEMRSKLQEELKAKQPEAQTIPNTETIEQPKVEEKVVEKPQEKINEFKDSLFFSDIATEEKPTEAISDIKGFLDVVNKEGIYELKDENDIPKFISEFKTLKEQQKSFAEKEQQLGVYENVFVSMPDALYKAVEVWSSGGDYIAELKNVISTKVDFTKPFEQQNIKDVVEHYFSGKFSEEDYSDEDNEKLAFAKEQAKYRFEIDQKNYRPYREVSSEKQEKYQQIFKESAGHTLNNLATSYKLNDTSKSQISKTLDGGQQAIMSLFFDKDGRYLPDAAEKLLMAMHGKSEIERAREFIKNRTASKVAEEFVTRGHDIPTVKGSSQTLDAKTIEEHAKKEAARLTGRTNF